MKNPVIFILERLLMLALYLVYRLFRSGALNSGLVAIGTYQITKENDFIYQLSQKIKNNTANDIEYLMYANVLEFKKVRELLDLDYLYRHEITEIYKESLKKSIALGNFEAKIAYNKVLFDEAKNCSDNTLKEIKLNQVLDDFENLIVINCRYQKLEAKYPFLHQYTKKANLWCPTSITAKWIKNIFDEDNQEFQVFPAVIQKAQLIMLYSMVKCDITGFGIVWSSSCDDLYTFYYTAEKLLQKPTSGHYKLQSLDKDRLTLIQQKAEILYSAFLEKYSIIPTNCLKSF